MITLGDLVFIKLLHSNSQNINKICNNYKLNNNNNKKYILKIVAYVKVAVILIVINIVKVPCIKPLNLLDRVVIRIIILYLICEYTI